MGGEDNNDIWESLLKLAATEYANRELEQYPSEEEMRKFVLPDEYDKKMRRWLNRYRIKVNVISLLKPLRKIAAAACIALGVGFAILLQFDEVRAACKEVIVQIYEKYIEFNYQSSVGEQMGDLQINYIPIGYYEEKRTVRKLMTSVEYRSEDNEKIIITCSTEELVHQIDNEHYLVSEASDNEMNLMFFDATENGWDNYLLWQSERGYFSIKASLSKDEMKKIAENIK